MTAAADRHLLFGLLALQIGLINQGQLVLAFQAWTQDKSRNLADHLEERGELDREDCAAVDALVARHLKRHGGDVEKSLAAVPAGKSTRQSLANLGDPDVEVTLGHIASNQGPTEGDDVNRTTDYSVGTATSNGQRFRVLRPHSRGGLGAVFVALDTELHREVALKQILDKHADDLTSRQRFLLEAEVTGGLEHPGIVPVYGLGTYGDGRPYYAMRFIRGDSLKEAIDRFHADETLRKDPGQRSLELRKLLRRLMDVCNAIDYAHSRGVLHRDIKPGNIIVGKHGETLVVDWGLAKAIGKSEPGAGERTLLPSSASGSAETLPGSALGTPAYMSPEQASGDLDQLGPRSDVYSLGSTLYYLLTGKAPQEGDDIGELLHKAQRGEFPRPRVHDTRIDAALEAVCLKAMSVQPGDRYATPRALADDVEQWMADEPVTAWHEPRTRRLLRWLTRHRVGVTAAGVAAIVALAGLAAMAGVQARANDRLHRLNDNLELANSRTSRANTELRAANERELDRFHLAMDAIKLFHDEVSEDILLKESQFEGLRKRLLRGAADFYGRLERLLQGHEDQTSRQALAGAYAELAKVTDQVGSRAESVSIARKALTLREELAREPNSEMEAIAELARSLNTLGEYLVDQRGCQDEALQVGEKARDLLEQLVRTEPEAAAFQADLARALQLTGNALGHFARPPSEILANAPRAVAAIERSISLWEELQTKQPVVEQYQLGLAEAYQRLGSIDSEIQKYDDACKPLAQAVAIYEALARSDPANPKYLQSLANAHGRHFQVLHFSGRFIEAMHSVERAVAVYEKFTRRYSAVTSAQQDMARRLCELAYYQTRLGRNEDSILNQKRALAIMEAAFKANPTVVANRNSLSWYSANLGYDLGTAGRTAEALPYLDQSLRLIDEDMKETPGAVPTLYLATVKVRYGVTLSRGGRAAEARGKLEQALAHFDSLLSDPKQTGIAFKDVAVDYTEAAVELAQIHGSRGDAAEAARLCQRVIERGGSLAAQEIELVFQLARAHSLFGQFRSPRGVVSAVAGNVSSESEFSTAIQLLDLAFTGGYRNIPYIRTDPALDPLRPRSDFRLLLFDLPFPPDPFDGTP